MNMTILYATTNPGKLMEVGKYFEPHGYLTHRERAVQKAMPRIQELAHAHCPGS